MRHILLAFIVLLACFTLAFADTWTNVKSGSSGAGSTELKVEPDANDVPASSTVNIPKSATIKVYDSNGVALDPQPSLHVSPTQGTSATHYTISMRDGSAFPEGSTVTISVVETDSTGDVETNWN